MHFMKELLVRIEAKDTFNKRQAYEELLPFFEIPITKSY